MTVRVNSERSGFKQRHLIERRPEGTLTISFANIRRLSIVTLLKALGINAEASSDSKAKKADGDKSDKAEKSKTQSVPAREANAKSKS